MNRTLTTIILAVALFVAASVAVQTQPRPQFEYTMLRMQALPAELRPGEEESGAEWVVRVLNWYGSQGTRAIWTYVEGSVIFTLEHLR